VGERDGEPFAEEGWPGLVAVVTALVIAVSIGLIVFALIR
jgi:hypothetical protein